MQRREFMRTSALSAAGLYLSSLSTFALDSASTAQSARNLRAFEFQSRDGISALWVGHSTILLNLFGTIVLCDPVMLQEIGVHLLGSTLGIRRLQDAAIALADLPCPDLVLLSHAHMDHMDLPTLEALCERFPDSIHCVCAKNTKDLVDDLAWKSCRELDWWESHHYGELCVSAVEVLHNGWRYPWEADRRGGDRAKGRSYNAYVLSIRGRNVVFGGDTAYTESFKELRNIPISLAFMPIGAYAGCSDNHCTPEEALQMAELMQAECVAPMHCLTFHQTPEPRQEPMHRFIKETQKRCMTFAWTSIGAQWTPRTNLAGVR